MGISTQTESLIKLYTEKIESDKKQLNQIDVIQQGYTITTGVGATEKIKVWGPNEVIGDFNSSIEKVDTRIVEINTQINLLQNQVLTIGQTANSVGCGTVSYDVGFTTITVYEDQLKYKGYKFTGVNPFKEIKGDLTSSNLGIGTYNYISPVAIGTYYDPVNTCYPFDFTCNSTACVAYAASITSLNQQISVLQAERDDIIPNANFLKNARIQFELQNYGYEQSKVQLNSSIGFSSSILSYLQDPANSEFL